MFQILEPKYLYILKYLIENLLPFIYCVFPLSFFPQPVRYLVLFVFITFFFFSFVKIYNVFRVFNLPRFDFSAPCDSRYLIFFPDAVPSTLLLFLGPDLIPRHTFLKPFYSFLRVLSVFPSLFKVFPSHVDFTVERASAWDFHLI